MNLISDLIQTINEFPAKINPFVTADNDREMINVYIKSFNELEQYLSDVLAAKVLKLRQIEDVKNVITKFFHNLITHYWRDH